MPPSERNALPSVGAAFWREDGAVMFTFVIDPGNVIGPRPATPADAEKHPSEWATFRRTDEAAPVASRVDAAPPKPAAVEPAAVPAPKRKYTKRKD